MSCLQILKFRKQGFILLNANFKVSFRIKSYSIPQQTAKKPPPQIRIVYHAHSNCCTEFSDSCKEVQLWSKNEYKCQVLKPIFQMQNSGHFGYLDYKNPGSQNTNEIFQPKYISKKERGTFFPCSMFLSACCHFPY